MLQVGSLGGLGLSMDMLLRAEAHAATNSKSKTNDVNCILIWTRGGTSHHDSTDPKPEAKPEIASDAPGDSPAPSPAARARAERIEREDDEVMAAASAAASVVNVGSSVAKGCRWVVFTIVTVALLGGAAVVYWILKTAGIVDG